MKIRNKGLLVLIGMSILLYFFKLGSFSLYDAAETTYGEFVKNILHSGNWLTLQYNGRIIFDKPPLYYWMVAILSKLIGFSEFAMRVPAALAGVLAVATTYMLGKKFYNERTGFLSGIIVMTAFQFLIQSRIAELDVLLALFFSFGLLLFYHGYQTRNKRFYALIGIPLGLGIIVKGLLGLAVPALAIFLFLLIKKKLSEILDLYVLLGLLAALAIGLPWYIAEYLIHGKVFLDFALGFLFLSRFGGVVSGHTGPWYYYFLALLLGFVPWSQFIPLAFWKTLKSWRNDPSLLCLCLCLPTFMVFSIAKTKIPNYILPLYPFLAIMVGKLWDDFLQQKASKEPANEFAVPRLDTGMRTSIFSFLIVVFLIFVGVIILGNSNYPAQYQVLLPPLLTIAGILLVGSLFSILFFFLKAYRLSFASLPAIVFAIMLVLTLWALPMVEELKGMKQLCEKVKQNIKPYEMIAVYNIGNRPSVVFYNPKPVVFLNNEKEVNSFLTRKMGYCFTLTDETPKFTHYGKIFSQKGDLAVLR